jgi:hypothetical protein
MVAGKYEGRGRKAKVGTLKMKVNGIVEDQEN